MSTYRLADAKAQWFAGRYPGAKIKPNCGVIHTTEGASFPSYGGGAMAPNYTGLPDIKNQRVIWRVHFPDEMSSRAMENRPGGVETNTANAIQVELVGTCDDSKAKTWAGIGKAGVDYIYWPSAPDWCLQAVADFLVDMNRRHGIKIAGPDMWLRYGKDDRRPGVTPASYGASPARMSFAQWRNFYGWCGHQHAPENSHGDPGALDFARIVALAKGEAVPASTPKPKPQRPSKPKPAASKAPKFQLLKGHWYGVESKNPRNHSGFYAKDRPGVRAIQARLRSRGWVGLTETNGRYGANTKKIVTQFQREKGLRIDGAVGAKTWAALWTEPVT